MGCCRDILGADALTAGLATGDAPWNVTLPRGFVNGLEQPSYEGVATFEALDRIGKYPGPRIVAPDMRDTKPAARPRAKGVLI